MATGIASGLGETFGLADEVTVGTFVTPARWIPHLKADFHLKKMTKQSEALRGNRFLLGSRRVLESLSVDGSVELDVADRQLGLIFQRMLGSTPLNTAQGGSAAMLQTHTPGNLEGHTLSIQKGVPAVPSGTIQAFSYNGAKITAWQLETGFQSLSKLTLTLDAWNEATGTAYTTATYLTGASAPNLLHFAEGAILLGGTVTTSAGITSISAGSAPTGLVRSVLIKGDNKVDTGRVPLGSTTKNEQITNAFSGVSGEIEIEFANLTDFYNAFAADTGTALHFTLTGPIIATTFHSFVDVILPSLRWEGDTPDANGTGIITVKVPFTALDDGVDPIIQIQYSTLDTTP